MKIRDYLDSTPQPSVVRLEHLEGDDAGWISASYYITEEIGRHFKSLKVQLARKSGGGIFLIGHYGSGKSHFLAYLTQQLRSGSFVDRSPHVVPVSLLNYKAAQPLESIVHEALATQKEDTDRRETWRRIGEAHPDGLFLILDELSEFLRSKPSRQAFNEDLRFLQFLGEWGQQEPLWILAALQEQIEHAGDIEYDLYRKIKDRYPVRFLLTPAHVKSLIAERILRKKPGYREAVERLARRLMKIYPASEVDYAALVEIYPLHPMTLELLEEVRDRFSHARGIIDFTLARLLGDEARGIAPFLDQPWGSLITPDAIVDHFADLFEVQPEFLAVAQKLLPYYRKQIPVLFETAGRRELAWRLLKLLMLVHLSPRRKSLEVDEASQWMLLSVSSVDPAANREVIRRILDAMFERGAFVKRQGARYRLDLGDDGEERLDKLVLRTMEELRGREVPVFESLVPCLDKADFNPFSQPRDRWYTHKVPWHFHDREIRIYFGGGAPSEQKGPALQIGVPWGPPAAGRNCYRIIPRPLELSDDVLELAALLQLKERPLAARLLQRIGERVGARSPSFWSLVRAAYRDATLLDATGGKAGPILNPMEGSGGSWLRKLLEWVLKQTYPMFESFAPGYGPLPREAYRQFMDFAVEQDLGAELAPDFVKLIREAYLVPMGLMQRRGLEYVVNRKLDSHELVRLIAPVIEHHPSPARVYEHLSAPVYGLVPDQIQLLLTVLLIHGEIDILKGIRSYRETYATLGNPLQYDQIVPGSALNLHQLQDLQILCEGFQIPVPKQWTVLAQKRAVERLAEAGRRRRDELSSFVMKLKGEAETEELAARIEKLISQWLALEKGEHELQGFQHFRFAIGTPRRFIEETGEMMSLPPRYEKLLREAKRFRHLFSYPVLYQCSDAGIAAALEALGQPPAAAEPEGLEEWLERAGSVYSGYQDWYRNRHEAWRSEIIRHPVWTSRIPNLARSRHLALAGQVREIEQLQAAAKTQLCAGMSALEFQPLCRCGFDGGTGPLSETLLHLAEATERLEDAMTLFFQQDRVKKRVREWVGQKLELNSRTMSYLEGKAGYPEVENLALFDQFFSGLRLVRPVEAEALLELVGDRVWEKSALIGAIERLFERFGPHISFHRPEQITRDSIVAWCCELALRHGAPLPEGFSSAEKKLLANLINPSWIGDESLAKLEQIGLPEAGIRRVLELLLDGNLKVPECIGDAGAVAAAVHLLRPAAPGFPDELARQVACDYEQHPRFMKLRPREWLKHLDGLANAELRQAPPNLAALLEDRTGMQWVVIDCLGLPLRDMMQGILAGCFPHWKRYRESFAMVARQSTTDAFYRDLLDRETARTVVKINAVDALVHERKADLKDLVQLARAEVEVSCRKFLTRLDPAQPVLVFGDHGFRISPDGSGFIHGGPSTLERIVPVFELLPLT